MRPLTSAPRRFGWTDVRLPGDRPDLWAHPGVAVGPDGSVHVAGADGRSVIRLVDDGEPVVTRLPTTECHGLAMNAAGDLWVADNGHKRRVEDGAYADTETSGQVIRVTPDGQVAERLPAPYPGWRPTGVAVCASPHGERILVADGYGASRVHCFASDGTIVWSTDAADSGTVFSTPHGIAVDERLGSASVAVADRRNRRIVMLDDGGAVSGVVGAGVLTSPSGLATQGQLLWVTELFGGLVAFDPDGMVVARVGDPFDQPPAGWPNDRDGDGTPVPPRRPARGFVSPHGIAAMPGGELIVTEWVLGGATAILSPL